MIRILFIISTLFFRLPPLYEATGLHKKYNPVA